ncbi:Na+/melibiose symporter [Eubacterium ruminantium]|jgi:MFS family permease|uniref:Na+/melibiose symporter n=1 Tax=Eubacterium ruminantium TaxID=42322 RepID=A0A1T4L1I7_9FIRM|nr:MFS transporter [Eubacterium ruminantium]SCW42643.1 Na+/melibiose symporter [Eubacterium ruminantium]SDN21316.1 Na+/melibiose symporter [Eubacterium ruminantium]SJZ48569.1 Na+/melibiose symporter [Eubacterium ruminantium]
MENRSNYKKFLLLWCGEFISSIGGGLTSFGLSIYIFQKTGSAASMGLVALLSFLPILLLSPVAGVLADRYDRCLMMMIGDGMSGLGLVYILICMFAGEAGLYQICIGVFISAVFSSLLEPSYRAIVTDMLSKDEYSKASGMMSIAGSARYLISPMIAGFLLTISDVKLLIIIDICTFILTVICTAVVRSSRIVRQKKTTDSFVQSFKVGWKAITEKKGIFVVIMITSVITCFMGAIQILVEPMILDFQTGKVLGIAETVCASGMLVSSIFIGIIGIKKNFTRILSISLTICGLAMIGFGLKENIYIICCFGFLFFFMLPFANNCLDYLARTNIDADKQGRAWGLISFLSQLGYVVAYAGAGLLADKIADVRHIGIGRGAATVIIISGIMLAIIATLISRFRSIRELESGEKNE